MKFPTCQLAVLILIASILSLTGCESPARFDEGRTLPMPPPSLAEAVLPAEPNQTPDQNIVQVAATNADAASNPLAVEEPAASTNFTAEEGVRFALVNNPSLQAIREQRGFALGAVVMARTYQYNPMLQLNFSDAVGPGVTNPLTQSHQLTLALETRGQRGFRKQAAAATVTRTEWDIATQELLIGVAANRAFNTVLYRQRKYDVLEETVKINEKVVDQVKKLAELGRLLPADLIVAQTSLDAARAQLGQGLTAIAFARSDLRRQLGTLDNSFTIDGKLDLPVPTTDFDTLFQVALTNRPDLQSNRMRVAETRAMLDLQIADRYGNPVIGPLYSTNETGLNYYGAYLGGPIPIFNTMKGQILQARATVAQAARTVKQFEVQSGQDVQAALARLEQARKWADQYEATVLPNLRKAVVDIYKLLEQNQPGVDVLKVIGVQQNYLTSFSAYLDALYEVSQARADLAAAVGDLGIAVGLYGNDEETDPAPKPKLLDAAPGNPLDPNPAPANEKP